MSKFTATIIALSALLLTACAGNQPAPLPTTFEGSLEQTQVVMMNDLGAAQRFCDQRLGIKTIAQADCYEYAKRVCFDEDDTVIKQTPLIGDCTRRWETYGYITGDK